MQNDLDPDKDQYSVSPDLGPNFFQRLSADGKVGVSRQRVKRVTYSLLNTVKPVFFKGAQWLSGRVLDSRPRGRGFEPHRLTVLCSLSTRHIYSSLVLAQPRKTRPCLTERLLMGRKESNQTNKTVFFKGFTQIGFQDRLSLNAGQKYCRRLQGEHSAILLAFIKLPFVNKTFVLSIFECPFETGFTVVGVLFPKDGPCLNLRNRKEALKLSLQCSVLEIACLIIGFFCQP